MTVEYGTFNMSHKRWMAMPCTSGGVIYYRVGADNQPIWSSGMWEVPNGEIINEDEEWYQYHLAHPYPTASYGITASFSLV